MKRNKFFVFTLILTMSLGTNLFLNNHVQAASINKTDNIKTQNSNINITQDLLRRFPYLKNKGIENEKLVGFKKVYVNIKKDSNDKITKNTYTPKEANDLQIYNQINEINKSNEALRNTANKVTPNFNPVYPTRSNSWVSLEMAIYSNDDVNFDIYSNDEWLTDPACQDKDVLGLSHGTQLNFEYDASHIEINNPYGGVPTLPFAQQDYTLTYTSPSYTGVVGGSSFSFQLGYNGIGEGQFYNGQNYVYQYPSALMYTKAIKVGSGSCELNLSYLHQENTISVNPAVNIPGGGVITITNTSNYVPFSLPYLLKF
jgi:hypothetical protein